VVALSRRSEVDEDEETSWPLSLKIVSAFQQTKFEGLSLPLSRIGQGGTESRLATHLEGRTVFSNRSSYFVFRLKK
jgi:hypothetical protein